MNIAPYLMDSAAEISLARSAAPESISSDATVLILGPRGYETAVEDKNGFVCIVERSWMLELDDPEFWNPKVRLPLCVNPPAARTHLPLTFRWVELLAADQLRAQIIDSIRTALLKGDLPMPELGSMCYMMSKQQYFGKKHQNAEPHLMFWFAHRDNTTWGANLPGSPVYANHDASDPITTFIISSSVWPDGTVAPTS